MTEIMRLSDVSDKIHIAFATNLKYIPYISVLLISILENADKNDKYVFHYVVNGIKDNDKEKLSYIVAKYGAEIKFYSFDDSLLEGFPLLYYNPGVFAAYYRCFLGELLDKNIKKVLYLDADVIVLDDISQLFNTDISDYFLGAVADCYKIWNESRMNVKGLTFYFNSGVTLLNLDKFRKENIPQKIKEYIKDNMQKMLYADQDALNAVAVGNVLALSPVYNVQLTKCFSNEKSSEEEIFENIQYPKIIHFLGPNPWQIECRNRYREYWRKYARLSPYNFYIFFKLFKQWFFRYILGVTKTDTQRKFIIFGIKLTIKRRLKQYFCKYQ